MIRIVIADDHVVFRRGLKEVLREQPDFEVVGEAGSVPELLRLLRQITWDQLILDLTMPGPSGFAALEEIRQHWPSRPVLVLSMHPEEQFAVRVIRAGGSGYLTKESAPEDLVRAIRKVQTGGKFVSPAIVDKLVLALNKDSSRPPHELLSNREFEVLLLIASGKGMTQIANTLDLSIKTISTHRTNILKKMNMKSNADLIAYTIHQQFDSPHPDNRTLREVPS